MVHLAWTHRARADDIPIVNIIEEVGPQQEFPGDKSFYVQGDAGKKTTQVQVAIVRIADAWLWNSRGESCAAIAGALHVEQPQPQLQPDNRPHEPGIATASSVFPLAEGAHRDDKVLLSSVWSGSTTDPTHFKVLISNDSKFIRAGASYCVYILKRSQHIDDSKIQNTLESLADDSQACEDRVDPHDARPNPHDQCQAEFFDAYAHKLDDLLGEVLPKGTPAPTCANDPIDAAIATARTKGQLAAAPAPAPPPPGATPASRDFTKEYCTLRDHAFQAGNHAFAMFKGRTQLIRSLRAVPRFALRGPDGPGALPAGWMPVDQAIGHAIAIALVRHAVLVTTWDQDGRLEYRTRDQWRRVKALSLIDEDRALQAADLVSGRLVGPHRLADVTTDDLVIAPGITLRDLIAFGQKTIHTTSPDTSADTTFEALEALLGSLTLAKPLEPAAEDKLKSLASKLYAFGAVAAPDPGPRPEPGSLADATAEIHQWLTTIGFDATPDVVKKLHAIAWLTTMNFDQTTMADKYRDLAPRLRPIYEAKRRFEADKEGLQLKTGEVISLGAPKAIPLKIAFNEQSWAFSFLAPMVGYAAVDGRGSDDWFAMYYTGFQLHLFANPVTDPLWSHGVREDYKRAFAIEVGAGLKSTGFGPGNRYTGILGPVPITVGAAFHLVPYTSVTLGVVLLERRATVLPADKGTFTPEFFIGLNVVPNLPDLFKQYGATPAVVK